MISTELYWRKEWGKVKREQYKFLLETLKTANKPENRKKRPWIIVGTHHPQYCTTPGLWVPGDGEVCTTEARDMRIGWREKGVRFFLRILVIWLVFGF